jgi:predicted outer membrane repeat protein
MRFPTVTRALIHILCMATLAALSTTALAAVVTNLSDSGAGSLRQAVIDTADGGEVTFQTGLTGTITLSTGEIALGKSLTISGPGSDDITVKAASTSRIFNVSSGTFVVKDLTLEGGGGTVSGDGGLIRCLDDLIVRYCKLKDGKASLDGGAVYLTGGELQCFNNAFQGNQAGANGGALHQDNSTWFFIGSCNFSQNLADTDGGALDFDSVTAGTISGAEFVNNDATNGNGGAIAVSLGDLEVNGSSLLLNEAHAGHGGAIYASGNCALELNTGCMLSTNTAAGAGGGICSMSGTVRIEDSVLAYNVASGHYNGAGGGGLAQIGPPSGWSLIIRYSQFTGNQASTVLAGGIYSGSDAEITNSIFQYNQSAGDGAGLYYYGDLLTLENCTFSYNDSGGKGGGICLPNVGTTAINLEQCTFYQNEAETTGGGVYTGRYTYLWACTFTGNIAGMDINSSGDGGGIHAAGTLQVRGSILAGNHDYAAGTQHNDCKADGSSSGSYTLLGVEGGCTGIVNGVNGNIVGTELLPANPRLSDLGYHGGPTPTCLLMPGSPALNGNIDCYGQGLVPLASDQRGQARPCGAECDMGAVEMAGGYRGMDLLLFESY